MKVEYLILLLIMRLNNEQRSNIETMLQKANQMFVQINSTLDSYVSKLEILKGVYLC